MVFRCNQLEKLVVFLTGMNQCEVVYDLIPVHGITPFLQPNHTTGRGEGAREKEEDNTTKEQSVERARCEAGVPVRREVKTMTQTTIQNATALLREIASLPEPERTEYVKMMRYTLMGLRLTEHTPSISPAEQDQERVRA